MAAALPPTPRVAQWGYTHPAPRTVHGSPLPARHRDTRRSQDKGLSRVIRAIPHSSAALGKLLGDSGGERRRDTEEAQEWGGASLIHPGATAARGCLLGPAPELCILKSI